jgi:hypothetical protein
VFELANMKLSLVKQLAEMNRKVGGDFFPICWVHRDDVVQAMNTEDEPDFKLEISDEQMERIADLMRENMVGDFYWDLVRQAYEKSEVEKK